MGGGRQSNMGEGADVIYDLLYLLTMSHIDNVHRNDVLIFVFAFVFSTVNMGGVRMHGINL